MYPFYLVSVDKWIAYAFGLSVSEAKRKRLEGAIAINGVVIHEPQMWFLP